MDVAQGYRRLLRRVPVMGALLDEEGKFIDVTDRFCERLGYERGDLVGRRPVDFTTVTCAARIERDILPKLRRTGRAVDEPVEFLSVSGEEVFLVSSAVIEQEPQSGYIRTVVVYQELGDSGKVERKYRQLYRATPSMLHIVDAEGRITQVSDHWLKTMGYRAEEVLGRSILDFLSESYRSELGGGRLQRLISEGNVSGRDRQMVTRDGRVIDTIMSSVSERDAKGRVVQLLVASTDVTERNRAERALRETLAENARLREELERERDYLREEVNVAMNYGRIVGESPVLKAMLGRLEAVAGTPANVLIEGESGVGKELVARAIHARSPRADAPLVKVNCATIPVELFESEFFGHVKGAFTGAHRDRVGRFQLADGGTIFLDEVGEIPVELQGKLLRVLQEREFERVGDDVTRTVDVRVIAATNRDLRQDVEQGRFREDLFYRLGVFPIEVPPLRRRGDDVVQIAQHFLEQACREFGRQPLTLSTAHVEAIRAYDWPGNVRELKNVIERAVILSAGNVLRLDLSLPEGETSGERRRDEPPRRETPRAFVSEAEMRERLRENLVAALEQADWKVSGPGGAAELLGLRPTTLTDRMRAMGIRRPERRGAA
ncbi:sigma 54-interacting transcriptional regulator [Lentisalinibacter orientalis]|uniref:sigma 54-interacting transcriptional regulator n=1 Tax=Lentisalinibacter orientalis TaxID=2992241 RepID=UPI0038688E37